MIGRTISHYTVLEKLGEGGMGVVYKARDTKLERDVALKFLPAHVSMTKENAARFLQEARAAAALNHANICTIYGVEEVEGQGGPGQMFIAMEYIDGGTLREKLPLGGVTDTVAIATQVGEALQEAHSKGIVHRDIKADNIMLNSRGQVKVMDFGLAKLKGSLKLTRTSSTVGTLGYMSPEQIGGGEVDSRSDIFSFGVLIFEMLTGRLPFRGEHEAAMVYSIMNEAPEPVTKFLPDAPPELVLLISKALEKDPAERYQAMSEMLVDLRRLKKSTTRVSRAYPVQPASTGPGAPGADIHSGVRPVAGAPPGATPGGRRKLVPIVVGASVLLIAAIAFLLLNRRGAEVVPSAANIKMSRLTSDGNSGYATISPDGKYVVYVKGEPGEYGLWIRQVASSTEIPVIQPSDIQVEGSTFSNDGNYVYYTASLPGAPVPTVYRTPVIGGVQPRKIIENVAGTVTLSPDDKRIAFFRSFPVTGEEALFVANADGSGERKLVSRDGKNLFFISSGSSPAWSPDGSVIACPAGTTVGEFLMNILVVPVDDPKERMVTSAKWSGVGRIAWYPDGRGLIACANDQHEPAQLFYVSYPGGEVTKITNDLLVYGPTSLSVTRDGKAIVSSQSQITSNIVLATGGDASTARELTHGATRTDGTGGLAWLDDGTVVYTSVTGGTTNLWTLATGSGDSRQLTFNTALATSPACAPGGAYVYYNSYSDTLPCIYRVSAAGGDPVRMTHAEDYAPALSPDGKWLLFNSWRSGAPSLWKLETSSGNPPEMFKQGANSPVFSTDGKLVACRAHDEKEDRSRLTVLSFPSGQTVAVTDLPNTAGQAPFAWSPDGTTIDFVDSRNGISNIYSLDYRDGEVKQVTKFTSGTIFQFHWSPDGKTLALARGQTTSDVVLLTIPE